MDTRKDENELHLLGGSTVYKQDYAPEVLEAFTNKHPENDYWVRFNCPEFTSLCPITGQPDFATIYIDYIPDVKMVESKSLKLYLFSFRNHGAFHEDCVNIIMKDLIRLMNPKYIEVTGIFTPRAESVFTRIAITAGRALNMRSWQNNGFSTTMRNKKAHTAFPLTSQLDVSVFYPRQRREPNTLTSIFYFLISCFQFYSLN